MPTITHKGVVYKQVKHAIQCKKCLTTVESKFIHDFKECPCGAVAVDGGILAGNSVLGDLQDIEDRGEYSAIVDGKVVFLPPDIVEYLFRRRMGLN